MLDVRRGVLMRPVKLGNFVASGGSEVMRSLNRLLPVRKPKCHVMEDADAKQQSFLDVTEPASFVKRPFESRCCIFMGIAANW